MNTVLRHKKVIDSPSKQEENVDFQGIHDKSMHSPPRQKMEWFLLNLSPLSEKVKNITAYLLVTYKVIIFGIEIKEPCKII